MGHRRRGGPQRFGISPPGRWRGWPCWPQWRWRCVAVAPGGASRARIDSPSPRGALTRSAPPRSRPTVATSPLPRGARLWVRSLDEAEPVALEGTDGAREPFWSPDSRSIGFFSARSTGNTIKTVGIAGAPPEPWPRFRPAGPPGPGRASGAILVEITETAEGEGWHLVRPGRPRPSCARFPDRPISPDRARPQFLPDGIHFLFTYPRGTEAFLQIGSTESEETQALVRADSQAVYVAPGYVLYVRDGVLLAQPFDARALRMTGEPEASARRRRAFRADRSGRLLRVAGGAAGRPAPAGPLAPGVVRPRRPRDRDPPRPRPLRRPEALARRAASRR